MNEPTSAENHDWDLTLNAAYMLLQTGAVLDKQQRTGTLSMGYAHFTGSMLLSFATIESFSASVAFSMSRTSLYAGFDYQKYRRTSRFKEKIDQIFDAAGTSADWSRGLLQEVKDMQDWRNSVAHSSPTSFDATKGEAPEKLATYLTRAELDPAVSFFETAQSYIKHLETITDLTPRTHAVFQIGPTGSTG